MAMTTRQLQAVTLLASRRAAGQAIGDLSSRTLAARGGKQAIDKQMKALAKAS